MVPLELLTGCGHRCPPSPKSTHHRKALQGQQTSSVREGSGNGSVFTRMISLFLQVKQFKGLRAQARSGTPASCPVPCVLCPPPFLTQYLSIFPRTRGGGQFGQPSGTSLPPVSINLDFLSWVKALKLLRFLLYCIMFLPFKRLAGIISVRLHEWHASFSLISLWYMLRHRKRASLAYTRSLGEERSL